jgi:hypothetical protein
VAAAPDDRYDPGSDVEIGHSGASRPDCDSTIRSIPAARDGPGRRREARAPDATDESDPIRSRPRPTSPRRPVDRARPGAARAASRARSDRDRHGEGRETRTRSDSVASSSGMGVENELRRRRPARAASPLTRHMYNQFGYHPIVARYLSRRFVIILY